MVAFFSAELGDFRSSGELADYRSSNHAVRRFCRSCGTHVLFDDSRYPDELDIATATLDDAEAAPPTFHIWTRSKLDWVRLADDLPAFTERSGS